MKGKTKQRIMAVVLTLVMAVSLLPLELLGGGVVQVKAADSTVHVFDASQFTTTGDAHGQKYDNDYFEAVGSGKMKVAKVPDNAPTSYNGNTYSHILQIDGKFTADGRGLVFTTSGPAEVTIYAGCKNGKAEKLSIGEYTSGSAPSNVKEIGVFEPDKTKPGEYSYSIDKAGTYIIGSATNGALIWYLCVDETPSSAPEVSNVTAVLDNSAQKATVSWDELNGLGTAKVSLSYSTDNGSTWKLIDDKIMQGTKTYVHDLASVNSASILYKVESKANSNNSAVSANAINWVLPRPDWANVSAPTVNIVQTSGKGSVTITWDMDLSADGADRVEIALKDADGKTVDTKEVTKTDDDIAEAKTYEVPLTSSGTYDVTITAKRDSYDSTDTDQNVKTASGNVNYILPLAKPVIRAGASKGNGSIIVEWDTVPEADSYKVYCDNVLAGTTESTSYVVTGLTVGQKYALTVVAVRGAEEGPVSDEFKVTATQEAQAVWSFTRYGSSTDDAHNGYIGDANEGSVTVYSEGGKGKIVPASTDGVAFYYTAVPTDTNFTLRANVHVDKWTLSNGQEGFGLLATDRLGTNGDSTEFWNNQYMACASKVEYYWNSDKQEVSATGDKYTMKSGIGVIEKTGVTKDNLAKLQAGDTETVKNEFSTVTTTLDTSAPKAGLESGTYNIIGNATSPAEGTFSEITDFILEIQKNNTGYFITYLDQEGNVINQQKYYYPDALNQLDSDNVYVGFFASRNARATFSNIQFSTIPASEDAPAESRPITMIEPIFTVQSAKVSNSADYTLSMLSNVAGTVRIRLNGTTLEETYPVKADVRCDYPIVFTKDGTNSISLKFTPDPAQELPEYTALANTDPIKVTQEVKWSNKFAGIENLYVSPEGKASGDGTKEKPLDIYSAINFVQPGQTIILMEGTYDLEQTVKIERGIDGTAEQNIRMIADPEATSRPVLDFAGRCPGVVIGGDYWYFSGFDVTRSQNAQKGIQVSGSNNVLDNINAYHNGNTGIQISRMYSSDATIEDWPANNLILNCTSYGNADAGYEDADGFAAKLTVGEGNVFDGCVAYNNADDGWDLFAKVETGPIGSVTIKNCVAYANGYLEDGTNAGNGNGFKMGGSSITGYHKLINSYAFFNKAKGIDSNSCPDIQVENSISYNNESYNVAFYTNTASKTDFAATGIISFKDSSVKSGLDKGDDFKKISQDETKYLNEANYYWNGTQSANTAGATATADWFKSLEFTGVTRNVDGTINMHGFLELTDAAPVGIGAVPGGTPSQAELTQKLKADVSVSIPETVLTDEVKKATGCNTVDELVVYLKTQVEKNDAAKKILGDVANSAVYEVTILTSIDGINWTPVTEENFPAKGVNVILPYPDGTNKNDFDFVVAHLITMNCNGEKAGTIEYLKPDKTRTGLKVHVNSASPFAIGWAEVEYEEEELAPISSVKTGDTTPVAPLLAIMLASAGICGVYVFRRKRSF